MSGSRPLLFGGGENEPQTSRSVEKGNAKAVGVMKIRPFLSVKPTLKWAAVAPADIVALLKFMGEQEVRGRPAK